MVEVNLLQSLPRSKRNISQRKMSKSPEVVALSREFGRDYFDGSREVGYGGYRYDGRWVPVAKDIMTYYHLTPGDRVLDVGCAKGFLVKDLVAQGIDAYGLDISEYALLNCPTDVVGRLHLGSAVKLPFQDASFDVVLAINVLHNLNRDNVIASLKEMQRVARRGTFLQVDSYMTPEQRAIFEDWVLTARFHDYPNGWLRLFEEAGYMGDYSWTIIE